MGYFEAHNRLVVIDKSVLKFECRSSISANLLDQCWLLSPI
jgi:hypothetical protein